MGVAVNPGTPVSALSEIAGQIDLALCMTVNPGWGGQAFIERSLVKLPQLRQLVGEGVAVEVDGGMDPTIAPQCRHAGANLFVAGSAVFDAEDPGEAYRAIVASISRG